MHTGIGSTAEPRVDDALLQLVRCGFQALGTATQGSGHTGRALSADGMTWAELVELRSGLRGSLRQLLGKGVLRGAGCTAQFTSEFANGDCVVTTTAPLDPADGTDPSLDLEILPSDTPVAVVALRHMRRLEAALLRRHPLRLRVLDGAAEVEQAAQRLRAPHPAPAAIPALSVGRLCQLGVPERFAQAIAGTRAATAAELQQ